MRLSLLAIPLAIAAASSAQAQSSVIVFGVMDVSISGRWNRSEDTGSASLLNPWYANRGSVTTSRTALTSGNQATSRLGFRGTEDLGGGMAASFWLEGTLTGDDGATPLSFTRRSTVSLSGHLGEVRVGRDYTPSFWAYTLYDPFGGVGVGTNHLYMAASTNENGGAGGFGGDNNYARASNSISYFLPSDLGGVYGQVMYAFHEQTKYDPGTVTPSTPNTSRTGRYMGARLGYANGPFDIAAAYSESIAGDSYQTGTTRTVSMLNLAGTYDFKVAKLFAMASHQGNKTDYALPQISGTSTDMNLTGYLLGVTVPVGAGLIRASYARVNYSRQGDRPLFEAWKPNPTSDKLALGYVHNLSKRTSLYATVARVSNKNGALLSTVFAPAFVRDATFSPKTATGYDLGIRHTF